MLISEEYEEHYCHPNFKDIQTIVIDYYFESPNLDKNGDRVIIGKGLDGVLYHWVHCKHNPPHQPTLNTKKTDTDNLPEPSSVKDIKLPLLVKA